MAQLATTIDHVDEDLLQNIIARLPALSFASAACVSHSWNFICNRVLCRPKLSSACSFNPTLHVAVAEVVNKVLSEPIRPHFAIVSIGPSFSLRGAHELISTKLGSKVPFITNCSYGIIGRDVFSDQIKEKIMGIRKEEEEVDYPLEEDDNLDAHLLVPEGTCKAIMLMVGFLPGLKVKAIPLLRQYRVPHAVKIDKFVTDIREFSTSVSRCNSPAAIIMFSEFQPDTTAIMKKLDYAMSPETVIVGDSFCDFLHATKSSRDIQPKEEHGPAAVALVFVMDSNKPLAIGDIQFHSVISSGLLPIGSAYEVTFVKEGPYGLMTCLTAKREGLGENLNGETILGQAHEELGNWIERPIFYIGVTKRRKCSVEQDKDGWMTSIAFHRVFRGNQEYLSCDGLGIETGDTFHFYHPNSTTALSSLANVSNHLGSFKQGSTTDGDKLEVFGGLIFASCGRAESFFGQPNFDSSMFSNNFPGVTLGGKFCAREIRRGDLTPYVNESQEQKTVRCFVHELSAVYLIMSYTP